MRTIVKMVMSLGVHVEKMSIVLTENFILATFIVYVCLLKIMVRVRCLILSSSPDLARGGGVKKALHQ